MFALSNQPQDFVKVTTDAYRLTIASCSKAWLASLLGNILSLSPLYLMYFFYEPVDSEFPSALLFPLCVMALLYPVFMASVLIAVQAVADQRHTGLLDSIKQGAQFIVPSTVASFLFLLFVSIGFVLLLIPGIFLFVALSFWWSGIIMENKGVLDAFRFSRQLVSKNWWRTAIVLATMLALIGTTPKIIEWAMNLFPAALADAWPVKLFGLVLTILDLVITPILFSALMVVQLNELKLRNPKPVLVAASEPGLQDLA